MKKKHLKLRYVLLFSLLSLFSCENSLLNESTLKSGEQNTSDLMGQQKAIAALNQFRREINQSPNIRSVSDIKIKSVKTQTYQIQFSTEVVKTRRNKSVSDTIDVYTIVFEKDGKTGFSILSPDERVGRMYAYTEDGSINDTITNKGLALHLNGIKGICQMDLTTYYSQGENSLSTKSTRNGTMYPNFMEFEWGQEEPFNAMCPKLCNGRPALAGGVAVAAAEIIMHYKKRLYGSNPGGGGIYRLNIPNSEDMQQNRNERSISTNYDYRLLKDYSQITNSSPDNVKNEAARLIYNLATLVGSRWGCGTEGYGDDTCADLNVTDVIFGPFINCYFKEHNPESYTILEYFESGLSKINNEKIINNLALGNPIIVQGMHYNSPRRHVWLYTGVKFNGNTINEFYINWGSGGSSNGWYTYNYNLDFGPYEVLFVKSPNPDAKPGGGTLE